MLARSLASLRSTLVRQARPVQRGPMARWTPSAGMARGRKAAASKTAPASSADPRTAALDAALRQIEGSFGKGSVMRLGQRSVARTGARARLCAKRSYSLPTNHQTPAPRGRCLDRLPHPGQCSWHWWAPARVRTTVAARPHARGARAHPSPSARRRIVEVYGPESSGKTTVALQAIAQAQKNGGSCCFIDAEHALDPEWARKLGGVPSPRPPCTPCTTRTRPTRPPAHLPIHPPSHPQA